MQIEELTEPGLIFPDLPGSDTPTVLRALADRVQQRGVVGDADMLYQRLFEREELGTRFLCLVPLKHRVSNF